MLTTNKLQAGVPSEPRPPKSHKSKRVRYLLIGAIAVLVLAIVGIPWIREALNTVSTDDAYVNGHVTFVAARVPGQVSRVLVDDNYRVKKGDLLVQLDKEPYEVAVAIKQAAVDIAKANLEVASALAYFDCFWVFAMITLALVPLVLLMKRSVAEKGARIGGE
jgi:membrane fusion protein, multidrug efflux system